MTMGIFKRSSIYMATVFAVVASMAGFSGCSKRDGESNKKSYKPGQLPGLGLKLDTDSPRMGVDVQLEVTGKYSIASVSWTVFRIVGGVESAAATMCVANEIVKTTCTFEEEGDYVAKAEIKFASGGVAFVEKKFTVSLPDGLRNQDPIIVLKLSSGNKQAKVATFRPDESGEASFAVGSVLSFDFLSSRDDATAASALTYEMSYGQGAAFEPVAASFTKTLEGIGQKIVTVRATDAQGNKSEKQFSLFVTCAIGGSVTDLVLEPSVISFTPEASLGFNFKSFKATGLYKSGGMGSAAMKYKWDFNGDGIFDTDWLSNVDPVAPVYVNHANSRVVRVKAWDTQCQFVQVVEKTLNFDWTAVHVAYASDEEFAAGPKMADYYYIQGKVTPVSEKLLTLPAAKVDFWGGDYSLGGTEEKRVFCQYVKQKASLGPREGSTVLPKGNIQISSFEKYAGKKDGVQFKQDGLNHGIQIFVNNIEDAVGTLEHPPKKGEVITRTDLEPVVHFYTDRMSDATMEHDFKNTQKCSMKLNVEAIDDGDPCAPLKITKGDGSSMMVEQKGSKFGARFWGTYSCPEMKDAYGESVKIDDGAFFCEFLKVDACTGCCCCCCCCGVPPVPK